MVKLSLAIETYEMVQCGATRMLYENVRWLFSNKYRLLWCFWSTQVCSSSFTYITKGWYFDWMLAFYIPNFKFLFASHFRLRFVIKNIPNPASTRVNGQSLTSQLVWMAMLNILFGMLKIQTKIREVVLRTYTIRGSSKLPPLSVSDNQKKRSREGIWKFFSFWSKKYINTSQEHNSFNPPFYLLVYQHPNPRCFSFRHFGNFHLWDVRKFEGKFQDSKFINELITWTLRSYGSVSRSIYPLTTN